LSVVVPGMKNPSGSSSATLLVMVMVARALHAGAITKNAVARNTAHFLMKRVPSCCPDKGSPKHKYPTRCKQIIGGSQLFVKCFLHPLNIDKLPKHLHDSYVY